MNNSVTEKLRVFPIGPVILGFLVFFIHYSGLISIDIFSASPFLLIPLTVYVAVYYGEAQGLFFGFFFGVLTDSVASGTFCFNTVILTLIGFLLGIAAKYFFNKNIYAVLFETFLSSVVYFGFKWLIFYFFSGVEGKMTYLIINLVPSALYTSLFGFAVYFCAKFFRRQLH